MLSLEEGSYWGDHFISRRVGEDKTYRGFLSEKGRRLGCKYSEYLSSVRQATGRKDGRTVGMDG